MPPATGGQCQGYAPAAHSTCCIPLYPANCLQETCVRLPTDPSSATNRSNESSQPLLVMLFPGNTSALVIFPDPLPAGRLESVKLQRPYTSERQQVSIQSYVSFLLRLVESPVWPGVLGLSATVRGADVRRKRNETGSSFLSNPRCERKSSVA